MLSTILYRY